MSHISSVCLGSLIYFKGLSDMSHSFLSVDTVLEFLLVIKSPSLFRFPFPS